MHFDKYGYSFAEKMVMVVSTGLTNFLILPVLIMFYRRKMFFSVFIGVFTMFTSFMYHFTESIQVESLILNEYEWHRLDNVGAIVCFISLYVFLADLKD